MQCAKSRLGCGLFRLTGLLLPGWAIVRPGLNVPPSPIRSHPTTTWLCHSGGQILIAWIQHEIPVLNRVKLSIIARKSTPCFWFPPPLLHWPIGWAIFAFLNIQWNFSVLQPSCCYCVVPSVLISPTPPTQLPSQWLLLPLLLPQPILPPQEPLAWPKLLLPLLLLQPVLASSCLLLSWSIFAWCGSLLPSCQGVPPPECYYTKTNASALCSFFYSLNEIQILLTITYGGIIGDLWLLFSTLRKGKMHYFRPVGWSVGVTINFPTTTTMIIQMDRPLANDHPDGLASCKWSEIK